jgi:iron(III) transport system substrate-binding protein
MKNARSAKLKAQGGRVRLFALCTLSLALVGCAGGDSGKEILTVYSPHGPELLKAFEAKFEEKHPGVDVQWLDLGSQEVLDRVRSEKANPQADVWFGAPTQLFAEAAKQDLLEAYQPSWAASVTEQRDPQSRYYGVYLTPEVIAYNSEVLDSASAPHDWDDILDPKWRGKVLIRDPIASGTMRTIFGMFIERSLRETGDTAAGFDWLRRLHGQTKEYVLNPTLLYQKLARQEGLVTVWDMPDIELLKAKGATPIDYLFPSSGTPLVVDGVAVVKGAPNAALARSFVDFVGSEEGVLLAARQFFRLPARGDIPLDSLPPVLQRARRELKPEPMDWQLLQERGSDWMRYWDEHVRSAR